MSSEYVIWQGELEGLMTARIFVSFLSLKLCADDGGLPTYLSGLEIDRISVNRLQIQLIWYLQKTRSPNAQVCGDICIQGGENPS